ncbi:alpha/beta hydrolase [Puia dinghuensis]|uniref:Phospholipase/carboxylesterase n=1 Tax=Puia dinghuensis TaxID=1792502 RepID=A0A8J2UCN5_9BACT|nr:dienelactone hydrolase family protein [Puia dinghuensis]GGA98670.1 phospholipase/carboxylesterase [Puia dinghuensis]
MHTLDYITAGKDLLGSGKALIMVHGRGGSAEDILSLADALPVEDFALFAPKAAAHSWYPYSFMAPIQQNEPWLTGALHVLKQLVTDINVQGVTNENIYFVGFSQGACLTLEFVARNATRYGGVAAFTGGLIGDRLYPHHYTGDFGGTPIFIGTSDPDPHVPVSRVHDSTALLEKMNAAVTERIYPGMGHTITNSEITDAAQAVFAPAALKK